MLENLTNDIPPPVVYVRDFAPNLFDGLRSMAWLRMPDAPRCEYYCNDVLRDYTYGRDRGRRTYTPQPWSEELLQVRHLLHEAGHGPFETVFCNLYLGPRDWLGWHADDSPEMDDNRPIAVVTFGAPRYLQFRPKYQENNNPESVSFYPVPRNSPATHQILLESGSLLLMPAHMQRHYEHRIPKKGEGCGERISLTYRGYVSPA